MDNKEFVLTPDMLNAIKKGMQEYQNLEIQNKQKNYEALNLNVKGNGVVFVGDSIIEGYPIYEMYSKTLQIYNRGISGLTAKQLYQKIEVHVDQLKPRKVILLIGTNDLGQGLSVENTHSLINEICKHIINSSPNILLNIISVLPVNSDASYSRMVGLRNNDDIEQLNQLLIKMTKNNSQMTFINAAKHLKDLQGNLKREYTIDGLHLSIEGYLQITKVIKQALGETDNRG